MKAPLPSILVVASNARERTLIASVVKEAGITAVTAGAHPRRQLRKADALIVALSNAAAQTFLNDAVKQAPRAKILLIMDAGAAPVGDDRVLIVRRPLVARELVEGVLQLLLQEELPRESTAQLPTALSGATPRQRVAAELGIATARLACLCMREANAAATGAGRLMHDLSRQIADLRAGLAPAAMSAGAN